ncbi:Uncharacterised protein [Serratia fonticola]|uniref:Uncharacterized protein n=1 Tax=Serratia fonticola TaxID=47917 RepID=A0A4U9VGJ6_SERFO|nr:Uncharacterised protein [Serratia fonticola]VTR45183.1 Uncharacterised protein [Serratia fonticola]
MRSAEILPPIFRYLLCSSAHITEDGNTLLYALSHDRME